MGWRWRNLGRGKDLQLVYLLRWPERPVVSQGVPAEVGNWDKAMCAEKLGGEP